MLCQRELGFWGAEREYLCPIDADPKQFPHGLVSVASIYDRLNASGAELKLLLLDACRNTVKIGGNARPFQMQTPQQGIVAIASCKPGEQSLEAREFRHGVFTHFVIEALRGGIRTPNQKNDVVITVSKLMAHVSKQTRAYVSWLAPRFSPGFTQNPAAVMVRVDADPQLARIPIARAVTPWEVPLATYAIDFAKQVGTGWQFRGVARQMFDADTNLLVTTASAMNGGTMVSPVLEFDNDFFVQFEVLSKSNSRITFVLRDTEGRTIEFDCGIRTANSISTWKINMPSGANEQLRTARGHGIVHLTRKEAVYTLSINGMTLQKVTDQELGKLMHIEFQFSNPNAGLTRLAVGQLAARNDVRKSKRTYEFATLKPVVVAQGRKYARLAWKEAPFSNDFRATFEFPRSNSGIGFITLKSDKDGADFPLAVKFGDSTQVETWMPGVLWLKLGKERRENAKFTLSRIKGQFFIADHTGAQTPLTLNEDIFGGFTGVIFDIPIRGKKRTDFQVRISER